MKNRQDIHENGRAGSEELVANLSGKLEFNGVEIPKDQLAIIDAAKSSDAMARAAATLTPAQMNGVWVCFQKPNGDFVTGGAGKIIAPTLDVMIFAKDLVAGCNKHVDGPLRFVVALSDWRMQHPDRAGNILVLPEKMTILPTDADGDNPFTVENDESDSWNDIFEAGVDHYVAQVAAGYEAVKEWYLDVDLKKHETVLQAKGQRPKGAAPL